MVSKIDSPYDRFVKTGIDARVRFVAIYVAPSVLLLTAIVYAFGEYKKWRKTEGSDYTLLIGALLWTLGQLLTLYVLVSNTAGLGFHYRRHTKSTRT